MLVTFFVEHNVIYLSTEIVPQERFCFIIFPDNYQTTFWGN